MSRPRSGWCPQEERLTTQQGLVPGEEKVPFYYQRVTEPFGLPQHPAGLQKEKAAVGSSHHRQLFVNSWAKPPLKGRETFLLHKPSGVDFCLFKLLKMKKLYCFQSGVAQPQLDVTPLTAAGPCQEPRDSLLALSMGKCESPLPCSPARPNAAARGDHECDLLLRAVRAGCDQLLPQGSTAPAAAWERKCWVWLRDPAAQNSRREAGPPSLTTQQDGTREAGPGGRVWALGRTPLSS